MQRITMSIDDDLDQAFNDLIAEQGYQSKSEAIRDLVRQAVEVRKVTKSEDKYCVASLSYVYDHHIRDLAQRLVELQHNHHGAVVATMHVHLDHNSCLETTILKGATAEVQHLADHIQAERGVRFAKLNLITSPHIHTDDPDHGQPHPHTQA
ncbi:MAG: nickel-responsive transcriptional regulator NikR [Asticcacaulis sp.]